MDDAPNFARFAVVLVLAFSVAGCGAKPSAPNSKDAADTDAPSAPVDHLAAAKLKLALHEFDDAADAAYKALVQDPDSPEATLVASQIELGRGNYEVAVDLVSALKLDTRQAQDAVDVKTSALRKSGRYSDAADALLAGLEVMPNAPKWRHLAWELLNRVGRREEASSQAEALCFDGRATQRELLSLVRRSWAFPFESKDGEELAETFEPGLGRARWHFTQSDFGQAMEELAPQYTSGFESPAATALYGRLLAETQAFEEFPQWHSQCGESERQLGDYWAALGTYFYDVRQYEPSARALLEAVYRNPTDRVSFQRLSKVFSSLERLDKGEQFRYRGVKISETEKYASELYKAPADRAVKLELARNLAELGRPFEMLQWSKSILTAADQNEKRQLDQQFYALRQDPKVFAMASAVSLVGVAIDQYKVDPGLKLLQTAYVPGQQSKPEEIELLARPRLVNVASEVGIDFQWYQDVEMNLKSIPIHESLGGGIGVFDYDLDGWPDAYLGQGSGDPPTDACTRSNVLLRNREGMFIEVTASAQLEDFNYTSGIACGDINQDGFPDLWIGALGHNRLFVNNGDGTFSESTSRLVGDDRFSSSLAIGDINGDALPDLFEANYIAMDGGFVLPDIGEDGKPLLPGPLAHLAGFDRWFENLGDSGFESHEITMDIAKPGTSLGVVVTDFDSNGGNEVFVGNDVRPNHFLFHRGENQFYNLADAKGVANGYQGVPNGCMGIGAADYNRDGLIDIHITNFHGESANLYIQNSSGLFTDVAIRYGVTDQSTPMVGFGTKSIDLDRNGWLDLLVTNGHIFDTRIYGDEDLFQMPPQLMMSVGRRFELTDVDDDSDYWNQLYLGRAMTSFDFDRNGTVDLLIGHVDQPVAVLRNETETTGNWLQLELVGRDCERDAVGARVVVHAGSESFTHWVTAGDGYLCSDEPMLDFGLGLFDGSVDVEVHWPGGKEQWFRGVQPGSRYLLVEEDAEPFRRMLGSEM